MLAMESQNLSAAEFLAAHGHDEVWLWYAGQGGDPRDVPKMRSDLTLREALALIRRSPDWYFYDIDLRGGSTRLRLGAARIDSLLAATA
jgi:hypothetical protein